jgi:hypothetical protein
VIGITGRRPAFCQARHCMGKKGIAAILLVVIAAWAEMAMAPMLAMHAGHMRPGHEMAADMPAEHSAHHHSQPAQAATGRPCCPGVHAAEPVEVMELVSGAPACDDPHSCCFRQGPQSVPAPARDVQRLARQMAPAAAVEINPERAAAKSAIHSTALILHCPPDVFGMTLRV